MRVLSVPARLRLTAALFVLTVPLAAMETVVFLQAPWWNLPYPTIFATSLAAFGVFGVLGILMARGRRWALGVSLSIAGGWVLASGWIAIRDGNFWLGVMALGLSAYFILMGVAVRRELGRSFFDPRLRWYEGRPRPIPGLSCKIAFSGGERRVRVARMDGDGVFVFGPGADSGISREKMDLEFNFRDRVLHCRAEPVGLLPGRGGLGLRFCENAPDAEKELGDFVEQLRGEGHVS